MLSRRVFLFSALSAASLPVLRYADLPGDVRKSKIAVFSENECPDTRLFYSCLPGKVLDSDPGLALQDLDRSMRRSEFDIVFGLTRDSNFVLIEQYALANSYQLHYHGTHRYQGQKILHSLKGGQALVGSLSDQIADKQAQWPAAVSQVPLLSQYNKVTMVNREIRSSHPHPSQGRGHLVSWLFYNRQA